MPETETARPTAAEAARRAGAAPTTELLDAVRAEGGRRRARRRRRTGALALAAVLVVAVPVAALSTGDGARRDDDVVAASDASLADDDGESDDAGDFADERRERLTPTSAVPTTMPVVPPTPAVPTTVIAAPAGDPEGPGPASTTSATPPRGTTPTVTAPPPPPGRVCRNSTDPVCGTFRFDPVPANAPLVLSATARTATVRVGDEIVVDVTWSDADAGLFVTGADWGQDGGVGVPFFCSRVEQRYGPWDPPPPAGGSGTYTAVHTYDAPGTYTPSFSALTARTSSPDCRDPYRSEASTGVTITVTP